VYDDDTSELCLRLAGGSKAVTILKSIARRSRYPRPFVFKILCLAWDFYLNPEAHGAPGKGVE
jgi:hypothetical protein